MLTIQSTSAPASTTWDQFMAMYRNLDSARKWASRYTTPSRDGDAVTVFFSFDDGSSVTFNLDGDIARRFLDDVYGRG